MAIEHLKFLFVIEDRISGKKYNLEFWGGILGVEQDMQVFSNRIKEVQINVLVINGDLGEKEKQRLEKLLPKTIIELNKEVLK